MSYVVHYCKNKDCNNAWIDEDLTNAQTRPPMWKFCNECCEKYGFINPATQPKRKDYSNRIKRIEQFKFEKQKSNENIERKLSA